MRYQVQIIDFISSATRHAVRRRLTLTQAWGIARRNARRGLKLYGGGIAYGNWGARGGVFPGRYDPSSSPSTPGRRRPFPDRRAVIRERPGRACLPAPGLASLSLFSLLKDLTMSPTREEIIKALEDPAPNPLAEAVAAAIARYSAEFAEGVSRHGGFAKAIRLTAPAYEIERVAFDLFVQELKTNAPRVNITTLET
jgi:hypothetical protein